MPSDIFGLGLVYETQVESTWPELSEFGYFGGGFSGIRFCTIDRLDFSSETVALSVGSLPKGNQRLSAVSNSNYGYFGGGVNPLTTSTIDRLDFSNETVSAPGNNLTQARSSLAAVSNSNYGYFGGGLSSPLYVCTIDRLDFSNETVSAPGNDLTQARQQIAAVSNSNYGYFGGGYFNPPLTRFSTIDRLDFSNETVSVPTGYYLTQAKYGLGAVSNSNYGYFAGGNLGPSRVCTIDRLDFSSETVAAPGTYQLTQNRERLAAVSNSNYGYFGGGNVPSRVNTIDRLDFSNETVLAPGNTLTEEKMELAGVSTKSTTETIRKLRRGEFDASGIVYSNYGYFGGGEELGNVNTIDRLDFSSETVSAPGNNLTQERYQLAAVSNSNYGYFGGGSTFVSTIDRLDFSTETVEAPGAYQLTEARRQLAAVSNSNYGYFGGGLDSTTYSCTIDRLDFSSETVTGPPIHGINLTDSRDNLAAVSNSNYGYFAGGFAPPYTCTIDRLDFSNETLDVPGTLNQLTQARTGLAGVSNSNYGYFGGGFSPALPGRVCTIDRLDFSNETVDVPGTLEQLTQERNLAAAVSNSNYGYFAGSFAPGPTVVCTIDRLDFSTETVDVPGTLEQLTEARGKLAGINIPLNQTRHVAPQAVVGVSTFFFSYGKPENTVSYGFGYFAGGTNNSTIDRLDFSTETVNGPSVHGMELTQARDFLTAVSSSNYGYFGGGEGPGAVCTIDRLDFSNETVTGPPVHGMYLTQARSGLAAVSSPKGYGYFAGGFFTPPTTRVSTIDRLDFSNETVDVPGTLEPLTQARNQLAAVSNSNYGYFGGGFSPYVSTIDRLDFYSETVDVPGTLEPLTQSKRLLAAVSNSNYGYFGGGQNPDGIQVSTIERLDFSNETVAAPGNNLPNKRDQLAAASSPNYGYFGGGLSPDLTPPVTKIIDRLDFSNETVSAPGNDLTQARTNLAGTQVNYYQKVGQPISKSYGYFAGGNDAIGIGLCTTDRLDFSSETVGAPGNNLTQARLGLAAVSNSNYGYFGGGESPSFCTIDRLDFSNETIAAPTGYYLTEARYGLAGVSNSNYGYFAGGFAPSVPGEVCTIDRLDFSTETVAAPGITPGQLTQARNNLAAVSNSNYGYFGGGAAPGGVCTIDRLDFSTETVTGPPIHGINLTEARRNLTAVSNSNYGYFAGGFAPPYLCTIDRLDFSSETTSNPPANLTQARSYLAGVSNSNYGYFGGGLFDPTPPGSASTIDRLDFSSETVAIPGAYQLTEARRQLAAVSN